MHATENSRIPRNLHGTIVRDAAGVSEVQPLQEETESDTERRLLYFSKKPHTVSAVLFGPV